MRQNVGLPPLFRPSCVDDCGPALSAAGQRRTGWSRANAVSQLTIKSRRRDTSRTVRPPFTPGCGSAVAPSEARGCCGSRRTLLTTCGDNGRRPTLNRSSSGVAARRTRPPADKGDKHRPGRNRPPRAHIVARRNTPAVAPRSTRPGTHTGCNTAGLRPVAGTRGSGGTCRAPDAARSADP